LARLTTKPNRTVAPNSMAWLD